MASANDELVDRYLERRGYDLPQSWDRNYNKKQCPECGGLHDLAAEECTVCGWVAAATAD